MSQFPPGEDLDGLYDYRYARSSPTGCVDASGMGALEVLIAVCLILIVAAMLLAAALPAVARAAWTRMKIGISPFLDPLVRDCAKSPELRQKLDNLERYVRLVDNLMEQGRRHDAKKVMEKIEKLIKDIDQLGREQPEEQFREFLEHYGEPGASCRCPKGWQNA